jgi:predicted Zn-dependent protease
MITNYKLNVIQEKNETINGLPAVAFIGDQTNEQTGAKLRLITYLIKYGANIYVFHGIAASTDFSRYSSLFTRTFESFQRLTDASKLNVKPERIKIATVKSNGTLKKALTAAGMAAARHEELALINGMLLTDQVEAGSLIKTVSK